MLASIASSLSPLSNSRPVPLIADADTGFGSPINIVRTVSMYINSNVAAFHIEDQVLAKRCGHLQNKALVGFEEWVTRIRAAAHTRAQMGRDIVIIARTDALQSLGYDEALRRSRAAVDAGADVAFLEGFDTREQARQFCKEMFPTPVLLNMFPGGVSPLLTVDEAKDIGARILIYPLLALSPVYNAVTAAAKKLKDTGETDCLVNGTSGGVRDIFGVCGMHECVEVDKIVGGGSYESGI